MKSTTYKCVMICMLTLLLIILPAVALLQAETANPTPPPISQPIVSEGMLAVSLATALGVDSTADEISAENGLGDIGIAPLNGWIADYPVTPDIIEEVRNALLSAVDYGNISLGRDEASKRYDGTLADLGLTVRPYNGKEASPSKPVSCDNYPNPAMISTTYGSEGPPVVTYYCPPADYYYLYTWVPYPFWWSEFWFPGFFILHDFHRHVHFHNRFVFVTNHFNDVRRNRMFRIDPADRFHGRTYAGIGARASRSYISTGIPHGAHTIFNAPRNAAATSGGVSRGSDVRSRTGSGGGGFRQSGGSSDGIHGDGGMRGSGGTRR